MHDADAIRAHFRWLLPHGVEGSVQLDQRGGGAPARTWHPDAGSLVRQVLAHPEARSDVGVNVRPAEWAGGEYRSCPEGEIRMLSAVRLDIDCARPLGIASTELIAQAVEKAKAQAREMHREPPAISAEHIAVAARIAEGCGLLAGETRSELEQLLSGAFATGGLPKLSAADLAKLATCTSRAASGQPASDDEHDAAIRAGRRLARWATENLKLGLPMLIDSGNGCHVWFAVAPTPVDDGNRETLKAGLDELEREARTFVEALGPRLRLDKHGGLAATTRLAGTPNRKGSSTPGRPHRMVRIVQGAKRPDGKGLAAWLLEHGTAVVAERKALIEARQREAEARLKASPDLVGEVPHLENRVEGAIASCLERHPLEGTGHDQALANLLLLARLLLWELDLDDGAVRLRQAAAGASPHHWTTRQFAAEVEKAIQRAQSPAGATVARGHLMQRWREQDAQQRPKERMPRAQPQRSNVIELVPSDHEWRMPEDNRTYNLRSPTVVVPAPEVWEQDEEEETAAPEVLAANMASMKDVTSFAVAQRLLEQIDQFYRGFVFDGGRFWLYSDQEGIFRRLPSWWLRRALQKYHGAKSTQQLVGASTGSPWFANSGTIGSALGSLQTLLEARQGGGDERSFFSESPALAVFGSKTLLWDAKGHRTLLADNDPSLRATFAYPFEFDPEAKEPAHLLRVMREDMFAGVEPEEADLRIQRIRQQFGLALLGAQRLANIHNVLILLGQGHDGKSTLLGILQACMPPGSWIPIHPQDLSKGTGDGAEGRADLHGKFAVFCDDVSAQAMKDSSHYKTATAYGHIRGRHFGSGQASFAVDVRATWLLACQELWKTLDKTRGFQRRHTIVEFPNSVPDGEADKSLKAKLLAHEKRQIVLWCVGAALELLSGGELAKPECSERLMQSWMMGDDDVAAFLEANTSDCSSAPKGKWPKTSEVWKVYCEWVSWVAGSGKSNPANLVHFARRARLQKGVEFCSAGKGKSSRISRSLQLTVGSGCDR